MVRFSLYNITRKQRIFIAVIALAIAAIAIAAISVFCSHHTYPRELVVADSLCESNPDSAEALLHRMPDSVLAAKPDRMYYDLLRIKASNNLYEPQKDSTIFRIVDFFEHYGDKERLCQAYYYQGKYYVQHNDAPQALKCFQEALDMSDDNTPLTFKSKIYSQSGSIFHDQDLFDDALKMYSASFVLDSVQKDTINMVNGLRDIAQTYKYKNKADSSEYYYKRAYDLSEKQGDKHLSQSVLLALASLYKNRGDIGKAHKILSDELADVDDYIESPTYCLAADIFKKEGNVDSVYYYCQKLLSVGTVYAKEYASGELYEYYTMKGDLRKALSYMHMYRVMSDSVRNINATQSVAKIHSLYNYNLREKENSILRESNRERLFIFIGVSLLLVLLIVFLLFVNERSKKKILEDGLLISHLEKLSKESCIEKESYKSRIRDLKQELDKVSLMRVERESEAASRKLYIYEQIKKCVYEKKNLHNEDWLTIENAIDFIYPDFKKILLDMSNISQHEYEICILVKLGFTNTDIATIMNRTPGTISLSRSTLYKKLLKKEGKACDFNDFINSL